MHIREGRQKLVAAAFIRASEPADENLPPDVSIDFRPACDCDECMEGYLRLFLVMCLQMSTNNSLDFDAVLQDARQSVQEPTYLQ